MQPAFDLICLLMLMPAICLIIFVALIWLLASVKLR